MICDKLLPQVKKNIINLLTIKKKTIGTAREKYDDFFELESGWFSKIQWFVIISGCLLRFLFFFFFGQMLLASECLGVLHTSPGPRLPMAQHKEKNMSNRRVLFAYSVPLFLLTT